MRDMLKFLGALAAGGIVYYLVNSLGAAAGFAVIAVLIVMLEVRLDSIARSIDANFSELSHLQKPTDD
jgi:hypothetical protein